MRLSLHRFPRESKVAAVVLGAALVQVGVLGALGLRSTTERRQVRTDELKDEGRRDARVVVMNASEIVGRQEVLLVNALRHSEGGSRWERVRDAMANEVAPLFQYAYLIAEDGRLIDYQRPPYDPPPAPFNDPAARARLDEVLAFERTDPARAVEAAKALAADVAEHPPRDAVAAALTLQSGARAAYARKERDSALMLARTLLAHYRTVRDDRGTLADAEPLGPSASAVICEVLLQSLDNPRIQTQVFVDEVEDRRIQAQRMRPLLSDAAYRVECDECDKLYAASHTRLSPPIERDMRIRLETCLRIDEETNRAMNPGRSALRAAAMGADVEHFMLDTLWLMTVIPFPQNEPRRPGDPIGVAFVAPPPKLLHGAVEPATRAVGLPDGVVFVVRDDKNHDLLTKADGPALLEGVPFGPTVPGLYANVVLADTRFLDEETASARRTWLAILAGAGLAIVAASLLAVRAVMREVRLARMKSDFVSNLSHELRTPLTSLRMFVETLREGRVKDEAEVKECLDVVAQETDRLQSLVERVLQFASFTRGRAPIELKSADAGDVARRAVALFQKRAEAAQASIELAVEDPLPESIIDRDAILQVFLNLLDNAVKYAGHNGGKIRVGVRPGGSGGVVIEVEDDGPGVPEKERELVFEEFYRGDETLSRRVEGTGIGLAVARRIVLAHGGRIDVARSERLGGAHFRVLLPGADVGRRLALEASSAGGRS